MFDSERDFEIEEILARSRKDLAFYLRTFLPERFYSEFGHQKHGAMFEALDDRSIQKLLIIGHRGVGKTSVINYGYPSREILMHNIQFGPTGELTWNERAGENFIIPLSATASGAVMQSENLKRELRSNINFKALMGDIRGDELFSKECWITSNDIMVFPRGSDQQVRGNIYKNTRPKLIFTDDLEKSEEVKSKEQRKALKEWFYSDVMNSFDRRSNDYRLIVVGTILHEDALLIDLKHDPNWTVIDLPLCDENYKSYWPTFMDDERVENLVEEFRGQGLLDVFYREYMNQAIAAEDAVFRTEYFKHYDEADLFSQLNKDENVETFILIDPAKTEKVHNAESAIVGVGIDVVHNKIYCRDIVAAHLYPEQIYKEAFDMAERLKAHVIGFEVTGLNEFIVQPMHNEMQRRGKIYELIELKPRNATGEYEVKGASKGKAARVGAMAAYYRLGQVYHNRAVASKLESQLMQFPRAKKWDVMDCFSYFIQMLEYGGRYFSEELEAAELDELESEEVELEREMRRMQAEDELVPEYGGVI